MFFLFLLLLVTDTVKSTVYNVTSQYEPPHPYLKPLWDARRAPGDDFRVYLTQLENLYVAYPETRKTGCIQVLTSTFISKAYCSLPTYCKHTQYKAITSGWFSSVGICYGLTTAVKIVSHRASPSPSYNMALDLTQGWCSVGRYNNTNSNKYPDHTTNDQIFVLICASSLFVVSKSTLSTYSTLQLHTNNNSFTLNHPSLQQSEDGRYCAPRFSNSTTSPFILGPYLDEESLVRDIPLFYRFVSSTSTVAPHLFQLDFVSQLKFDLQTRELTTIHSLDPTKFICEPYKHTLNLLPFSVGSIFATIVHVLELILQWTVDILFQILESLYHFLNDYYLLSLTSFFFVTYATFKYGNAYAIIVSYFLSLFVTIAIRTITA